VAISHSFFFMQMGIRLFTIVLIVGWISSVQAQETHHKEETPSTGTVTATSKETAPGSQPPGTEEEALATLPSLAEIIPLATDLSGRRAALENRLRDLPAASGFERQYAVIEDHLKDQANRLQRLKEAGGYRFSALAEVRAEIEQENASLQETLAPLERSVGQVAKRREEWLAEKKKWGKWQLLLLQDGAPEQLKSAFANANVTVDSALDLLTSRLGTMLEIQAEGGRIQEIYYGLAAELDGLMASRRRSFLLDVSPVMFSARYFSQFDSELWYESGRGLHGISWPDERFFARKGSVLALQVVVSLMLMAALYRNRQPLQQSDRWRFLAARPFSSGLFFASVMTMIIYAYDTVPATVRLVNSIVGLITFVRLSTYFLKSSWRKQFLYALTGLLLTIRLMDTISLPFPLTRVFVVFAAAIGLFLCLRWAGESRRDKDPAGYFWILRTFAFLLAILVLLEIWGRDRLPAFLLLSLANSIAIVLISLLFLYMIHGGLEWMIQSSPLIRLSALDKDDIDAIYRRLRKLVDVAICGLLLPPALLFIWGAYENMEKATVGVLGWGFTLGPHRITVGLVLVASGILYGSFFLSWILQKLLIARGPLKHQVEKGVLIAVGRLIHYSIVVVGFLLAVAALGFELTQLVILVSALGVGIGFGLQGIVNNFVSGLILLFEQPVRVGDCVELGDKWAEIKKIGLRATFVRTYDEADIIIPNSDLISNQVVNWTLSDRRARVILPVGVAYGSDIPLVIETLLASAKENSMVADWPEPQVLFMNFGESALNFELRVWILEADNRLVVRSEINQKIDQSFRKAGIVIAFPQRDLHLRSADESVTSPRPRPDPPKQEV